MLKPSIDQLLEKVDSKYRLVKIAITRSKAMQEEGIYYLDKYSSKKVIGKALEEVYEGIITYEEE